MAVFKLKTDDPSETDDPSSKSVKIVGKTDAWSQADCPSEIKTVQFQIRTYYLTRVIQRITRIRFQREYGQWLQCETQLKAVDFFVSGFCYYKELVFISRFHTRDGLSIWDG